MFNSRILCPFQTFLLVEKARHRWPETGVRLRVTIANHTTRPVLTGSSIHLQSGSFWQEVAKCRLRRTVADVRPMSVLATRRWCWKKPPLRMFADAATTMRWPSFSVSVVYNYCFHIIMLSICKISVLFGYMNLNSVFFLFVGFLRRQ